MAGLELKMDWDGYLKLFLEPVIELNWNDAAELWWLYLVAYEMFKVCVSSRYETMLAFCLSLIYYC